MTVFGIGMVKDEADIIERTVRHMLDEVDHVVIMDNGSTDGTREILAELPIDVLDDPDPAYYQSRKMTALASQVGGLGATWVVPFDADEWWYAPGRRIRDLVADVSPDVLVVTADLYDHVSTGHDDSSDVDPVARMGWRKREVGFLPKVACRVRPDLVIHQGNHGATYEGDYIVGGGLVIRHFPYRSVDQFASKALNGGRAYAATDLAPTEGQHWREYGALVETHGRAAAEDIFTTWFFHQNPRGNRDLIFDPVCGLVPL